MTGKIICQKKKKVPPCEPTLCQRGARINTMKFRLKTSVIKEVLRRCWQNRVAKRERGTLPVRFRNLHDVREGSEVHVTILDRI